MECTHFIKHIILLLTLVSLMIDLQRDATALIVASERGHIKVVQLLLDCGAELDIQMKVLCSSSI